MLVSASPPDVLAERRRDRSGPRRIDARPARASGSPRRRPASSVGDYIGAAFCGRPFRPGLAFASPPLTGGRLRESMLSGSFPLIYGVVPLLIPSRGIAWAINLADALGRGRVCGTASRSPGGPVFLIGSASSASPTRLIKPVLAPLTLPLILVDLGLLPPINIAMGARAGWIAPNSPSTASGATSECRGRGLAVNWIAERCSSGPASEPDGAVHVRADAARLGRARLDARSSK